jgi:hypothetical protein
MVMVVGFLREGLKECGWDLIVWILGQLLCPLPIGDAQSLPGPGLWMTHGTWNMGQITA